MKYTMAVPERLNGDVISAAWLAVVGATFPVNYDGVVIGTGTVVLLASGQLVLEIDLGGDTVPLEWDAVLVDNDLPPMGGDGYKWLP
jgi:hypothetical protein